VRTGSAFSTQTFDAGDLALAPGDHVVVDTRRGPLVGKVLTFPQRTILPAQDIQRVLRRAESSDLAAHRDNEASLRDVLRRAVVTARRHQTFLKFAHAEWTLDRSRLTLWHVTEERVDPRRLLKALSTEFHARVELRQLGLREGAGAVGGIGPCGNELCCSVFLHRFAAISIRYAKDQGLSLNPGRITGMCGRLKCCLVYEFATYKELRKLVPKPRLGVRTPLGTGNILDVFPLTRKVVVELQGGVWETFHLRDVVVMDRRLDRSEYASALTREEQILDQRRQRRGGTQETRSATPPREATSVLQEDYLWAKDESPELLLDTSTGPQVAESEEETAARKRRRRRKKPGQGGSETGSAPMAADSASPSDRARPPREPRPPREAGEARPPREPRPPREAGEARPPREPRPPREAGEARPPRDSGAMPRVESPDAGASSALGGDAEAPMDGASGARRRRRRRGRGGGRGGEGSGGGEPSGPDGA
jgi:cell fate regulator YaaT (PSP1 superfamily)